MHARTVETLSGSTSASEKLGKITFLLFMLFVFFGTDIPFREPILNVEDIGTSNVVNQVVFSTLFVLSLFCLLPKRQTLWLLIKREKFLTAFLVWCMLSIVWSQYSLVSFKRIFQIITTVSVTLALLLHIDSPDDALIYFKWILYLYIPLTVASIIFIPDATDPVTSAWRGFSLQKNQLGQASLVSIVIWIYAMRSNKRGRRIASFGMLITSVVLLLGSNSMTSIMTACLLGMLGIIVSFEKVVGDLGFKRAVSSMAMMSVIGGIVITYYLAPEIISGSPTYIGRDITFTGRTVLWADILEEAKDHLVLGCGYGSFWTPLNMNLLYLYEDHVWLPNQAHMGYLDILNETGIIGLVLFILMVMFYFAVLMRGEGRDLWKWFTLIALVVNFQESTLFVAGRITGVMFIFAYLALYLKDICRRTSAGRLVEVNGPASGYRVKAAARVA